MEGERTKERVYALRLPHGDEAIRAELAPLVQEGKAGTQVRVETRVGFFYGPVAGFAIPAGTPFQAEINGEQQVRISLAALPPKSAE